MERAPRVAVIGAGLAGLFTASRLARRGFNVAVLERESRPGGRAAAHSQQGFALEAMSPLLSSADRGVLDWISESGLRDELLPLRPVVVSQVHQEQVGPLHPRGLLEIARIPGIRWREALRLMRLPRLLRRYGARLDFDAPERAADLDDRSVYDFGRLYFGESVVDRWMAPQAARQSLAEPRQTSRALFLRRLRRHHRAQTGLPRATLGMLAETVAEGLSVQFDAPVVRIETSTGGGLHALLHDNRAFEADAIVVATDAHEAARMTAAVLSGAERDGLARIRYAPSISLAIGLRRPFSPHPMEIHHAPSDDSPLATTLLEPGVPGGRVPEGHGLATLRATAAFSRANAAAPDAAIAKALRDTYIRIRPDLPKAMVFERVLRLERAQPEFGVGRYRDIARFQKIQSDQRQRGRRLYFTGDYLVDPSWEGALASAHQTVAALVQDLI